ncbi:hypothetical protein [Micromonospora sp. KC213]|nr:hypothetical protein [Micromonospora sp. KC213]
MPAEQIGRWTSVDNTDVARDGGRNAALSVACSLHAMRGGDESHP